MKKLILFLLISLNASALPLNIDTKAICKKEKAVVMRIMEYIAAGKQTNDFTFLALYSASKNVVNNCEHTNTPEHQLIYMNIMKTAQYEVDNR